jgi:hypothetical protein
MTESAAHVRVIEETPAYWRVAFDYPPFNIVDATIFEGLQDARSNGRQPEPACRGIREARILSFTLLTLI